METTIFQAIVPLKKIEYGCYIGLYRDNGKENGNYYIIIVYILGLQSPLSR